MNRKTTIATILALGLMFALVGSGLALQPDYGSGITVDGDPGEWDLTNDFFADMHEEGNPTKPLLSKSYLRYDCTSNMLYVLVLTENGVTADLSNDDAWVKIYDISNSPQVGGNSGSFARLPNNAGYEASFSLAEGSYSEIEIHLNVTRDGESGRTSSTGKGGKKSGPLLALEIICPAEPQTGTITIEKLTDPAGGTGFGFTDDIAAPNSFGLDHEQSKTFLNVAVGSYTVTEDEPFGLGYYLTDLVCGDTDAGGTDSTVDLGSRTATINLDPGETVECTYTNSQLGTISGLKFQDEDPQGVQGAEEPGLSGWTIELWTDEATPQFVASDTTDLTGYYTFTNILPGQAYIVCEVLYAGWTQTFPTSGAPCTQLGGSYGDMGYSITPIPGQVLFSDNDFGNYPSP